MAYHAPFDLDLPLALKAQLVGAFDRLAPGLLSDNAIKRIKSKKGVYKLFHKKVLVYVGKADNLRERISEHQVKISGRQNIVLTDIHFKCLYVGENWVTLAPEDSLIKHFKKQNEGQCEWNGNGFGPHDPGRERETTNKPMDGFDMQYPIRHEWACDFVDAGHYKVIDLLICLKQNLPFLLRYESAGHYKKGHPDQQATLNIQKRGVRADVLLGAIARAMTGWQATRFPGHMILYKESKPYRYGLKL